MKQLFFVMVITLSIIAIQSCKENEDPAPEPVSSVLEYFPLNVGNYWIYERFHCDSSWTDCDSYSIDTIRITKDTMINNNLYYKYVGTSIIGVENIVFLRDSGNYIVSNSGSIFLTDTDFDRIVRERYEILPSNDTLLRIYYQFKNKPNIVEVPTGTYDCIDFRASFFRAQDNFSKEFNQHQYFAKGVGQVYQNALFFHSLGGVKQELISYNIESE